MMNEMAGDLKQISARFLTVTVIACLAGVFSSGCRAQEGENRTVNAVRVLHEQALTAGSDGNFYFPRYANSGAGIFFTSVNRRGIWYLDLTGEKPVQLNDYQGAGHGFALSGDDAKIYFSIDSIGPDRRKRSYLYEQDIRSGQLKNLLGEPVRSLSQINIIDKHFLAFLDGGRLRVLDLETYDEHEPDRLSEPLLMIHQNQVLYFLQGKKSVYDPFQGENLIWCKRIPSRNEWIVYAVGRGLYALNRQGEIVGDFGDLRAAVWAPAKDLIAFMLDTDDGMKITGSDVYLMTPDKRINMNVTNTADRTELYPEWSPDGSEIVFHTDTGQIYRIQLDVK